MIPEGKSVTVMHDFTTTIGGEVNRGLLQQSATLWTRLDEEEDIYYVFHSKREIVPEIKHWERGSWKGVGVGGFQTYLTSDQ